MSTINEIQLCLNCKKSYCDDCLDSKYVQKQAAVKNGTSRKNTIECNGELYTMKEWARLLDIKYATLTRRIRENISIINMAEYQTYLKASGKKIAAC